MDEFIDEYSTLLEVSQPEFPLDLPHGCTTCDCINRGKKPEIVTISHAVLKKFTKGIK